MRRYLFCLLFPILFGWASASTDTPTAPPAGLLEELREEPSFAVIVIERHPPAGWQDAITPGFDPPIEAVLVEPNKRGGADLWGNWGPDAIPVLLKHYRDADWASYRDAIRRLLLAADKPELQRRMLDCLVEMDSATSDTDRALRIFLVPLVAPLPDGREYIRHRLDRLEELAKSTPVHPDEAEILIRTLACYDSAFWASLAERVERAPLAFVAPYLSNIRRLNNEPQAFLILERLTKEGNAEVKAQAQVSIETLLPLRPALEPLETAPRAPLNKGKGAKVEGFDPRAVAKYYEEWPEKRDPARQAYEDFRKYAEALGNRAIPFLAKAAGDSRYAPYTRDFALAALGSIGTKKSVAKFAELRDAALRDAQVVQPEPYRHIDAMVQAAMMLASRPFSPGPFVVPRDCKVRIEPDCVTGTVVFGRWTTTTFVKMKRFGREWVPVEVHTIAV